MKPTSGMPITERERSAEEEIQRSQLYTAVNRKLACPSGQRYDIPATPADVAKVKRLLGEKEQDAA